jgi:hypothetical protein
VVIDAAKDFVHSSLCWVLDWAGDKVLTVLVEYVAEITSIMVELLLLHLMTMTILAEALEAEVIVIADGTMVPHLHDL